MHRTHLVPNSTSFLSFAFQPQDQKSILDFFSSQTEPSQLSSRSTNSSSQDTSLDLSPVQDNLTVVTTTTPCIKEKRPFPLFTSRRKSSGPQPNSSQDSIVIDSSDDEVTCVNRKTVVSVVKQKKSASVSRKRKCTAIASLRDGSDSEFEQTPPVFVHSETKKTKFSSKPKASTHSSPKSSKKSVPMCDSVTPAEIVNTESSLAGLVSPSAEASRSNDAGMTNGREWSCSACTFSNSSLLPFCEICETPRKQKTKAELHVSQNTKTNKAVLVEAQATVASPLCLAGKDESLLTSPPCSSTQVPQHSLHATPNEHRTRTEQISDEEDSHLFSRHPKSNHLRQSRHRVNRNLVLDSAGEPQTDLNVSQPEREETWQKREPSISTHAEQEEVHSLESPEPNSQSIYDSDKSEASDVNVEGSELEPFQQNSREDDGNCSPGLFESDSDDDSEVEDSNKTLALEVDEHVSLFSSPDSVRSSDTVNSRGHVLDTDMKTSSESAHSSNTVNSRSHILDSGKKACVLHTDLIDTSHSDSFDHESDESVEVRDSADAEVAKANKCKLPEVKPPKRRCFMLDTNSEDSVETQSQQENGEVLTSASITPSTVVNEPTRADKTSAPTGEIGGCHASGTCDLQSNQQLHRFFFFCCSSYTGRVYIFDEVCCLLYTSDAADDC